MREVEGRMKHEKEWFVELLSLERSKRSPEKAG